MSRFAVAALVILGVLCVMVPAIDAAPMIFAHQGRVLDGVGQPLNGVVDITFTLYDASSDGVVLWSEAHPAVPVAEGLFSVLLGSVTPLSTDLFASPQSSGVPQSDLYLEISVNGEALSPRSQIVSTPYSAVAIRVDGDLQTGPGSLSIDYRDADDDGDGILTADLLDSASLSIKEADGLGNSNSFQYKVYQPGQPVYGNITFEQSSGGSSDTTYDFSSREGVTVEKFHVKQEFGPTQRSSQGVTDTSGFVDVGSDDGDVSSSVRMGTISTSASVAIKTKGTGADANRVVSVSSSASDSSLVDLSIDENGNGFAKARGIISVKAPTGAGSMSNGRFSTDENEDGNPEAEAWIFATADSTGNYLDLDSDDDGISDIEARVSTSTQTSKVIVRGWDARSSMSVSSSGTGTQSAYDSNGDSNPEASITCLVTADSSIHTIDLDSDDDGIPESESELRVLAHEAAHVVQQKSGVGISQLTSTVLTSADSSGATIRVTGNVGINEPIPDTKLQITASSTSVLQTSECDVNKDGKPDVIVSKEESPSGISHTFVWNSLSDLGSSSGAALAVDSSKSGLRNVMDFDRDGIPDILVSQACLTDSVVREITFNFPDASTPSNVLKAKEKANKVKCSNALLVTSSSGVSTSEISCDTAANASFAQSSSGSSPDDGTSIYSQLCTADSVVKELTFAFPDTTAPTYVMKAKEKANKTKCSNGLRQFGLLSRTETETSCDTLAAVSTWTVDDFGGALNSVTIQASLDGAVNPIEHTSGAHLTPGGVWTNASDVNLKENFQPVDGDQLLDKIESLDISEWNYKTEDDAVRHIGPTAQDFQKTFGVGSDGKSISTIDPSGIALAAIKALNEKSKRVDQLETELAQLKTLVEKLISEKK